jgi:serine/threonine protein kinase
MAPEVLSSQTFPASDLWAAGVMAYQLLSGYLPFDDHRNPNAPALSVVWKGILTEAPSFRRSAWADVSPEARAFVSALLNKDHAARPTAKEALKHPWLQTAFHTGKRRPLSATVVQRIQASGPQRRAQEASWRPAIFGTLRDLILCPFPRSVQRFAQANVLRRTILELIANELLKTAPPHLSPDGVASSAFAADAADALAAHSSPQPIGGLEGASSSACTSPSVRDGDGSAHSGAVFFPMSPEKSSAMLGERGGAQPAADISRRGSLDGPFWVRPRDKPALPRNCDFSSEADMIPAASSAALHVHAGRPRDAALPLHASAGHAVPRRWPEERHRARSCRLLARHAAGLRARGDG